MLNYLKRRIMLMFGLGTVTSTDDSKGLQVCQLTVLADETLENVVRMGDYGYAYRPPEDGTEHITAFMTGNRDYGVVLAAQHRDSRPRDLEPGENMIYTDEGDFIYLKRGREVEIFSGNKVVVNATEDVVVNTKRVVVNASESFTVNSPTSTINSDDIALNGDVTMPRISGPVNDHTHGGVESGGSSTSSPN